MPVNQYEAALFSQIEQEIENNPPKPLNEMSLIEFREGAKAFNAFSGEPADVPFKTIFAKARDGFNIPIRLYEPKEIMHNGLFIFFPGCGYVCDFFETNCIAASRIAHHAKIKVAVVNYRLAPENALPKPIQDGYDASKYLFQHANEFNIGTNNIILGGISSGAHCATNVSKLVMVNKDFKIKHQILLNGCYDLTRSHHEFDEFQNEDKMQSQEGINYVYSLLKQGNVDFNDPVISPVFDQQAKALPPTTIMIGEYDALRSDSEAYYNVLKQAGTKVEKNILEGETHNTLLMMSLLPKELDTAVKIAETINNL
ncbi:alpha/beta hydrolase [Francisellaceae bacterium]|nr:alpha/beta hydrolase [Francisellaceae bacterium]